MMPFVYLGQRGPGLPVMLQADEDLFERPTPSLHHKILRAPVLVPQPVERCQEKIRRRRNRRGGVI